MFGRRQVKPEPTLVAMIGELQARVSAAESQMRTLEVEQTNLHAECRRYMRRAVAAERTVDLARGGIESGAVIDSRTVTTTPIPPQQTKLPWGAAGRIAARNGAGNGIHSSVQPADTSPADGR